ncbi:MAG: hypothetical protein HRT37_17790 [Alteromonadaceae bacterium]|nr:hypothetical protein [Alteromonadaceae bacterium]
MAQDKMGFLWLGTPTGLVRYDGYEFRRYSSDANSSYPLVFSEADNIFIDSKGRFWIGSWGHGLAVYSKEMKLLGKYTKHDLPNSTEDLTAGSTANSTIQSNKIQTFFEDSDGDIWIGTNGGGLALFIPETNSFKSYLFDVTKPNSISHNRIWSIVESEPGVLWVATSDGLNKFDKEAESFKRFNNDPSNPTSLDHSLIRALHVVKNTDINHEKNNVLWVGTQQGLGLFDIQTEKFIPINPENIMINTSITKIRQDKSNHLWIGTSNGLYQYDLKNNKFIVLSNENKGSDENNYRLFNIDDIRDIAIDSSGLLWLANRYAGLVKIDLKPNIFEKIDEYVTKNGSSKKLNRVQAIYEDSSNVLWLSTKEGIFYKNNKTGLITRFTSEGQFNHLSITAIGENKSGELWFGGHKGLYKIDKERSNLTDQNKLLKKIKIKNIKTLLFDKDDTLWIGTGHSGIVRIDGGEEKSTSLHTTQANTLKSLIDTAITSIYQDNAGRIWIGTREDGLVRLDPNRTKVVKYVHQQKFKNSISDNAITSIYQTLNGDIWVGTKRSLDRYNGDTDSFEHFGDVYGSTNGNIKAMIEDDFGVLWLSTNSGISQLDRSRKKIINYDFKHDLQEENFLARSVYKDQDGSVFFGGNSGITKITLAQVKQNNNIPSVVITDVWIDNDLSNQYTIGQQQPLDLNFDIKNIKFRFAAIDFKEPGNNLHSYRLIGFDDEWSQPLNSRTTSYTNLVPGEYYFEVKGSNNSNVWNPVVTRIKIIINPPGWQRWWAYVIYALILAGLFFTFIRVQRNKVLLERRLNLQLEQKVIARTSELEQQKRVVEAKNREVVAKNHEVEAKNEEILAAQDKLVQSEKMASLGTLTAGVAHEINNPINYTNAAVYMMTDEIKKIKNFLIQLAGGDKADAKILESFEDIFSKLIDLTRTASEGSNRIKIIVGDLGSFARLGDVKKSKVQISELIKSTINLVKTQYDSVAIKTQLEYDPLLTCFSSKLNQVFMNMIVNACQAVETRQEQLSNTENEFQGQVIISSEQGDNELIIRFKDNGCGMDEATQDKIFEPFFTTKVVGRGTGLGLAISFGIIQDHGGRIEVNSIIGEGTRLSIYLPV